MHELQVTERILEVVLRHAAANHASKVLVIHLRVGELSDLEDEWIQHYFDYLSRDTVAAEARLAIARAPIVLACDSCSFSFAVKKKDLGEAKCPECGEPKCHLESGRGYLIETLEVI